MLFFLPCNLALGVDGVGTSHVIPSSSVSHWWARGSMKPCVWHHMQSLVHHWSQSQIGNDQRSQPIIDNLIATIGRRLEWMAHAYLRDWFLSSVGTGRNCALPMKLPNLSPVLHENCAPMGDQGPEILSNAVSGRRLLPHFQTPVLHCRIISVCD